MTLSPDIHDQAARLAFNEGRSLSNYVEFFLKREIARTEEAGSHTVNQSV